MIRRIATAFFFLLILPPLLAQAKPSTALSEVRVAFANFIQAFDNLNLDTFRLEFYDDATVFYPRVFTERANGRAEFEKTFKVVFDQIRGNKAKPPYMDIQPKD